VGGTHFLAIDADEAIVAGMNAFQLQGNFPLQIKHRSSLTRAMERGGARNVARDAKNDAQNDESVLSQLTATAPVSYLGALTPCDVEQVQGGARSTTFVKRFCG
jgi:hypothetical protein